MSIRICHWCNTPIADQESFLSFEPHTTRYVHKNCAEWVNANQDEVEVAKAEIARQQTLLSQPLASTKTNQYSIFDGIGPVPKKIAFAIFAIGFGLIYFSTKS